MMNEDMRKENKGVYFDTNAFIKLEKEGNLLMVNTFFHSLSVWNLSDRKLRY